MNAMILLGVVALGLALAGGLGGQAAAQYPEVNGHAELTAGDATPAVGDTVPITVTVEDEGGVALADVECSFRVAQQPGSTATVDAGPVVTGADGTASTTLHTGDEAGTIVVEAVCGELSAQVSVVAGRGGGAAPPASLPDTGTGLGASDDGWAFWGLIGTGAALFVSGLAISRRKTRA
jgi:hypothetical protein